MNLILIIIIIITFIIIRMYLLTNFITIQALSPSFRNSEYTNAHTCAIKFHVA